MIDIPVGLSNHHVHMTREVAYEIFGEGYELTCKRELLQKGEFACHETVDVVINGKKIERLRVIGPYRKYTQVELLDKDCDYLEVEHLRRNSGDISGSIPFKLIGPYGEVDVECGAFVANNHIHFSSGDLEKYNCNNGDIVSVMTEDGKIIDNVFIKSDDTCIKEFHINKDEGENLGIVLGDTVKIVKKL